MTRRPGAAERAEHLLGASVIATAPLAGGDIATAVKLRLSNGRIAVMKTLHPPLPAGFPREAGGLRWLAEAPGGAPTPEVLAVAEDCLIIEWIETGRPTPDAAAAFGRALAATHAAGVDGVGARPDGYIGRLPMANAGVGEGTWAEFFVARRVSPYLRVGVDKGQIEASDAAVIERAAALTAQIVPEEPPARLHGDLWNGNVLWGADGRCRLIDPAAYGGHREMDLAMLALFGLPQLPVVLDAYQEAAPLADGWEDRVGFHQLFPLLVHACLFGGGYGARAATIARRYV